MVSIVPNRVLQASIISVVLHNLIDRDPITGTILIVPICQFEYFLDFPATQRRIALVCGDRWPHILEDHSIVP